MDFGFIVSRRYPRGRRMTARRREVLVLFDSFTARNGYSPSVRELMRELGLRSPSTVQAHLEILERDGFLIKEPARIRPWRLTHKGRGCSEQRPAA